MSGSEDSKRKNGRSVRRWLRRIFFEFPLAALGLLLCWTLILKFQQPEFELPPPADEDSDSVSLPAPPTSNVTVSIAFPFEDLASDLLGIREAKSGVSVAFRAD